jgi:hypothetical protein
MRLRSHLLGVAVLVAAAAAPAPASAQTGDPEQGSPSGVIYEIPLDNARRDAAPTKGGGGKGGSGGGTTSGSSGGGLTSPIRSENGFGSSATVPGVKVTATKTGKGSGKTGKGSSKAGSGSSKGGSAAKAPVMTSPSESLGQPTAASLSATPSKSRAYLLLALALAVAAGIGVAGRYVARRR